MNLKRTVLLAACLGAGSFAVIAAEGRAESLQREFSPMTSPSALNQGSMELLSQVKALPVSANVSYPQYEYSYELSNVGNGMILANATPLLALTGHLDSKNALLFELFPDEKVAFKLVSEQYPAVYYSEERRLEGLWLFSTLYSGARMGLIDDVIEDLNAPSKEQGELKRDLRGIQKIGLHTNADAYFARREGTVSTWLPGHLAAELSRLRKKNAAFAESGGESPVKVTTKAIQEGKDFFYSYRVFNPSNQKIYFRLEFIDDLLGWITEELHPLEAREEMLISFRSPEAPLDSARGSSRLFVYTSHPFSELAKSLPPEARFETRAKRYWLESRFALKLPLPPVLAPRLR